MIFGTYRKRFVRNTSVTFIFVGEKIKWRHLVNSNHWNTWSIRNSSKSTLCWATEAKTGWRI